MRIVVLGGTRFIGAAVVEELFTAGHDVVVVHRGRQERDDLPNVEHRHLDRGDGDALRAALRDGSPDAVVDTCAYTGADATTAVAALPAGVRTVVLSSMDTYRAFGSVHAEVVTDALPLDETSPVRTGRYLFRGTARDDLDVNMAAYENLDVEDTYRPAGATVLRLPVVYGERDPLRREGFVLDRLRAGRARIPIGAGTFLWTKGWVRDVARAVRLAVERDGLAGDVLNIGERQTWTMEQWAREIIAAVGSDAELVRVADHALPEDLRLTAAIAQHVLVDSSAARTALGWADTDPAMALRASVEWHMANPPPETGFDAAADDAALAQPYP